MSKPVILVTGGYDHKIKFWDATSGMCTKTITFMDTSGSSGTNNSSNNGGGNVSTSQINCLAISTDKCLLAVGGNPNIHLYDISNTVNGNTDEKPIIVYEGHTSNVTAVGFQKEQKWLFSSSEDGTVRVWDTRSPQMIRRYECSAAVNTLCLHPNQADLISGDQNGFVRVWDLEADKCREEIQPEGDMPVRSISISNDSSLVAVGMHKGKLFLYEPKYDGPESTEKSCFQLVNQVQAHSEYLLKCVISPDVTSIATCSADKSVKLWRLDKVQIEDTKLKSDENTILRSSSAESADFNIAGFGKSSDGEHKYM